MAGKKRLATVLSSNPLAVRIVEHAVTMMEVDLDWLEAEVGDVPRFDIVATLKELEQAGAGTFVVGRRGKKSRFIWNENVRTDSESGAAPGVPSPVSRPRPALVAPSTVPKTPAAQRVTVQAEEARLSSQWLQHSFHLRPGIVTVLDLPADITKTEVDRLCGFLQAIPFQ